MVERASKTSSASPSGTSRPAAARRHVQRGQGTAFVPCRPPRTMGCASDSRAPSKGRTDPARLPRTFPVRGRVARLDRTPARLGHRPAMHPTPEVPSSCGVRPVRADVRELARARQAIAALTHPDTRAIVDTAMGTLHAALSGGGLQVSKIPGLQSAIRKHVRQAWMDGIIAPLARSRHPADRAVLDAIPKDFALKAHAEVLATLERIARWIPEDADGTRQHVGRAFDYLRMLPLVLQALADLEVLAPGATATGRPASEAGPADLADATALVQRRLKAALSPGLPSLVDDLADLVYRGPLGAADTPTLRWTAAALLAPPARGARKSDRGGPQWRRGLAIALSRDLVDEALAPAAGRLLRRHVGLEVGDASYIRGEGHGGRLNLALSRDGVRLLLSVRFDIAAGRFEQTSAAVLSDGVLTTLAPEGVEALLDASIPSTLDTPAHRAMRRLSRRDGPSTFRLGVTEAGELAVAIDTPGKQDVGLLAELVRSGDDEGVAVRFAPGRDMVLAAGLIELGFGWCEDANGRYLLRAPYDAACRPGR